MLAIKIGNRGFPPLLAAGVRSAGAAVLVAVYAAFTHRSVWPSRVLLPHAAAIGALFAGEFFFLYLGLTWTSASRGVVLLYTMPFWTALGAHLLFPDDRISKGKVVGLTLSFAGIFAVFGAGAGGLGVSHWAGDLMEVGGALFWALTTLYVKRMGERFRVGALQVLFYQLVFSAPILLLLSVFFEAGRADVVWRWDATLALVHQIVVVATLSYLGWFWLIERYKVSSVSSFTFFTPLFGVLAGGFFLAEPLPLLLWVGVMFVGAGVYLVNRAPGAADGAAEPPG
jgi:drug/metabolite transporter (DMT)-like permease